MARICTKCGYEGRGKREGKGGGGLFRLIGMLTLLPAYSLWRLFAGSSGNMCPHCGLPTMVRMNSNQGKLARQMIDIELGVSSSKKDIMTTAKSTPAPSRVEEKREPRKPVNPEEW